MILEPGIYIATVDTEWSLGRSPIFNIIKVGEIIEYTYLNVPEYSNEVFKRGRYSFILCKPERVSALVQELL